MLKNKNKNKSLCYGDYLIFFQWTLCYQTNEILHFYFCNFTTTDFRKHIKVKKKNV